MAEQELTKSEKLIWQKAMPYLSAGIRKDFVVHTGQVVRAALLLLQEEEGDRELVIPASILHDVGWSRVPESLQKTDDKNEKEEAMKMHLEKALPIAKKILRELGYAEKQVKEIKDIIFSHKYADPEDKNKRLLIDADNLSDIFPEQFYEDAKAYGLANKELLKYRSKNKFYTMTAKRIFERELRARTEEIL